MASTIKNVKASKKAIYAEYGIQYNAGKIYSGRFGWISPLLVNGNSKLGKGVWTWSMLAGTGKYNFTLDDKECECSETCSCDCPGCYAKSGFYQFSSTIKSLGMKTIIATLDRDFMYHAIMAQIKADNIKMVRIHAAGDFFSDSYIKTWKMIAMQNSGVIFWTYTKNSNAESAFTGLDNANIVKSIIPGIGLNFGHCDYILDTYKALKANNKSVYICRCGIDPDQHCNNCTGCSKHNFVLFIEHSTSYKAESDPVYSELKSVIENQ